MKKKSYKQVEKVQDRFIEEYFNGTRYGQYYSGCGISRVGLMQPPARQGFKDKHLEDLCLSVLLKSYDPIEELPNEYCGVRVYYRVTGGIKALKKDQDDSLDARDALDKFVDEYFTNSDNKKYLGSVGLIKLDLTEISLHKPKKGYSRLDGICLLISLKKEILGLPQEYGGYKVMYRIQGPITKRKVRKR